MVSEDCKEFWSWIGKADSGLAIAFSICAPVGPLVGREAQAESDIAALTLIRVFSFITYFAE